MSEMTRAEEEQAADMTLDGQIAELMEARARASALNWPEPLESVPNPEPPPWYDDPDEMVAFARWYWSGALNAIGTAGEILDYFEKPWLFNEEYHEGFLGQKVKVI